LLGSIFNGILKQYLAMYMYVFALVNVLTNTDTALCSTDGLM